MVDGGRRWRILLTLALLVPLVVLFGRPQAARAQGCATTATVTRTPQASAVAGTVAAGATTANTFTVTATLSGLTAGQVPTLIIATTTGTVNTLGTAAAGAPVTIATTLTGVPLASGLVIVTVNNPGPGQLVSQGTLACG